MLTPTIGGPICGQLVNFNFTSKDTESPEPGDLVVFDKTGNNQVTQTILRDIPDGIIRVIQPDGSVTVELFTSGCIARLPYYTGTNPLRGRAITAYSKKLVIHTADSHHDTKIIAVDVVKGYVDVLYL